MPDLAYNGACARSTGTAAQTDLACRLARSVDGLSADGSEEARVRVVPVQIGQRHESGKMLHGFTDTVWRVRADDPSGTYRTVYAAQLGEAVYVLHAFQKKATSGIATPQRELDLIRQRLQLARKLAGK